MYRYVVFAVFTLVTTVFVTADDNIKEKAQKLANELYKIEKSGGDQLKYSKHALNILEKVFFVTPENYVKRSEYYNEPVELGVDLFSLLSGGLAIRESLQLDSIAAISSDSATIDIKTLKAPQIESHPFSEMLKGKNWKSFSLATSAPYDFYYFHFNNMKRVLDFLDYLESMGGSLHQRFTPNAVDFNVKDKILTQLALRITPEARKFYDTVIDEMAIVGSDPFFIEGTDVTLLYRLKNPMAFKLTMAMYRTYFTLKHKAKEKKFYIGQDEVSYFSSEDGAVNSYLVTLPGNKAILSNSRKALEIVLETSHHKRQSLQESPDFRYMRSIYPANAKDEDGFLYLSDPFIHHLISPELRIKEARRMAESMRIAELERYVILYFQLYDKFPETINELISKLSLPETKTANELALFRKSNSWEKLKEYTQNYYYLQDYEIDYFIQEVANSLHWANYNYEKVYQEGEEEKEREKLRQQVAKIVNEAQTLFVSITGHKFTTVRQAINTFEQPPKEEVISYFKGLELIPESFTARSKKYGKIGHFVPNIEREITSVSTLEESEYNRFAENYTSYWRTYFDPIGVRISMRDTVTIETCILPLINNSIYDMVKNIFGGESVSLAVSGTDGEIMSFGVKIDKEKFLSLMGEGVEVDSLDQQLQAEFGTDLNIQDIFDNIGGEIEIHVLDNTPLIDFESSPFIQDMLRWGMRDIESMMSGLLGYSIFHPVRLSIGVKDEAKAEKWLQQFDKVLYTWKQQQNQNRWDRWGPKIDSYSIISTDGKKFRTAKISFYGIIHFHLFYAVHNGKIHITTTQEYLRKILNTNTFASNETITGNIRAIIRPSQMQKERDSYEITMLEAAKDASYRNLGTIHLLSFLFLNQDELADKCLENFGFKPISPVGGTYIVEQKTFPDRIVRDSALGNYELTVVDFNQLHKTNELHRFFSTQEMAVTLEFTPEGIKTTINIK